MPTFLKPYVNYYTYIATYFADNFGINTYVGFIVAMPTIYICKCSTIAAGNQ